MDAATTGVLIAGVVTFLGTIGGILALLFKTRGELNKVKTDAQIKSEAAAQAAKIKSDSAAHAAELKEEATSSAALLQAQLEDRRQLAATREQNAHDVSNAVALATMAQASALEATLKNTELQLKVQHLEDLLAHSVKRVTELEATMAKQVTSSASLAQRVEDLTSANLLLQAQVTKLIDANVRLQDKADVLTTANIELKDQAKEDKGIEGAK